MTNKITIVLIDDNASSRGPMAEYFREVAGFEVKEFGSGNKALDFLYQHWEEYTAVITDYTLHDSSISGTEVLNRLRKETPYLPVIVISGQDLESLKTLAKGAYATMQKPIALNELSRIIEELAEQETAFQRITEDVKNLLSPMGFEACLTWCLDKKEQKYRAVAWTNEIKKHYRDKVSLNASDSKWQEKFRSGEPRLFSDVNNQNISPGLIFSKPIQEQVWRSMITIPLIHKNRIIGLIDSFNHTPFTFKNNEEKELVFNNLRAFAHQAAQAIRATYLSQNARAISEINQNMGTTHDQQTILDSIVGKALELTGADFGWVYVRDFETDRLTLLSFGGIEKKQIDEERELGEGITGVTAEKGDLVNFPDVILEPYYRPTPGQLVKSEVAVPLKKGHRTIGVLVMKSQFLAHFTEDDIDLLTSLAASATAAIGRAKLTQHLQEISRLSLDETKYVELGKYFLKAVQDLTGADVNFWRLSREEGEGDDFFRSVAQQGNFLGDYLETKLPANPESCVVAHALWSQKPVVLKDIFDTTHKPAFLMREEAKKHEWKSFMAVPFIGQEDEKIGVLSLYGDMQHMFSEQDDGKLIWTFASQAAIAFQQQERMSMMKGLAEIGQNLSVNENETKMFLKKVVTISRNIIRADCTVLYPFDSNRHGFFNRNMVVQDGLRDPIINLTDKPRTSGLAAEINRFEMIVVNNVGKGQIRINPFSSTKHFKNDEKRISELLSEYKPALIKRENIHAFVGVSLMVKEHGVEDHNNRQKVGVIYFNYRYPHQFSNYELKSIQILTQHMATAIHSNWLFEEKQRQTRELEAIHESAIAIVSKPDMKERLQKIVEDATELLKGKGGKLYLRVQRTNEIELVAAKNVAPDVLPIGTKIKFGEGVAWQVMLDKKPIIVGDYAKWPNRIQAFVDLFTSVIEVPLMLGEEAIGVLAVFDGNNKKDKIDGHIKQNIRQFNDNDAKVLQRLAQQAALAIRSSELYLQLETIRKIGLEIIDQGDIKKIANKTLDALKKIIGYDKATIQLIEDVKKKRIIVGKKGFPKKQINEDLLKPVQEDKLTKDIVQNRVPFILSNVADDERWIPVRETENIQSWACVPLMYGSNAVGMLTLDHFQPGYYKAEDKKLLSLFANQVAIAIHNAQLIKGLQHKKQQLERLHKAGIRVSSHPVVSQEDLTEVLIWIAESVKELFKADVATIFPYSFEKNEFLEGVRVGKGVDEVKAPSSTGDASRVVESKQPMYQKARPKRDKSLIIANRVVFATAKIPLLYTNESVGVLYINYFDEHDFEDDEKTLIELFAQQAAIAIKDTNLSILLRGQKLKAYSRRFNPYVAGRPINNPKQFYGRDEVIQSVLDSVHNNHYIIFGERRIGKTSVLHQIKNQLEYISNTDKELHFMPIYINIQGIESAVFFRFLISEISKSRQSSLQKLNMNISKRYTVENFEDDMETLIEHEKRKHPEKEIRIVLLLDEADTFIEYKPSIHERFRAMLQSECGKYLRVVMAGVFIDYVVQSKTSPWYNMMKTLEVLSLEEEEGRRLIIEPVLGYYAYEEDAIQRILMYSDLKPQDIQQLCLYSIDNMLNRIKNREASVKLDSIPDELIVKSEDVEFAFKLLIKEKDGKYREQWKDYSDEEKQILEDAAAGNGIVVITSDDKKFKKQNLYNITIPCNDGNYKLTYLFKHWLQSQKFKQ